MVPSSRRLIAMMAVLLMANIFPVGITEPAGNKEDSGASADTSGSGTHSRAIGTVTPIIAPTVESLYAVDWDPFKGNALIAGSNGTVLEYNSTAGFRAMQQDNNFTFRHIAFRPSNSSTLALLAGEDMSGVPLPSSVLLLYNGSGFTRIPTDSYKDIAGIAWSADASLALVIARKGLDGVVLKYQGGNLTEVLTDTARNYKAICWGEQGAWLAAYNFDNSSLDIQLFDGSSVVSDIQVPAQDVFATDISWGRTLGLGLCTAEMTTLLRFSGPGATRVADPSLKGELQGCAWAPSRPLALVAGINLSAEQGRDGLLFSYNGSNISVESTGRFFGLNDVAWHPGDMYALVTGDNGTVLRYSAPNNPPWCAIISPRLGDVVNGTVNITGTAWDPDSDPIVSVQVRVDNGAWQNADGGAEWSYRWETTMLANGAHTIWARSNDGLEDSAWAQTAVIVSNPDRPPAVSISGPSEGAVVQGMVSITGTSSDPDTGDTVTAVQVAFDGGQWSNASGTSVWNLSWDTGQYQDGPHTIRARAHDGELYSQEAVRNVSVQNHGPDFPPSCTIGSPTSGSLVSGDVLVQGTASDAENALRSVMVRIDSGGWQTASGTASWSFLWDTRPLPGGAHTLTAHAFDGVQNSSDVRITVQVGHQPVCSIISPASGAVLSGELTIQGTASDPDPGDVITSVKVRIDSGDWATATGTASWTYRWNTSTGSAGQHVIRARCSDGTLDSAEVSRTVTVEKPPTPVRLSEPTEAGEEYIILHWTTNTDPDFARYEVFSSLTEGAPLSGLSPRAVPAQSVTVYNYTGLASRTTYWFRVRVIDNSGQSSVSNEVFATTTRANIPPVGILSASRIRAPVGESITFNAEGSYDRDGRITRYQWDFDGKGRFPLDTGPIAEQRHQFRGAGRFLVQVRITDDRGATNTSSVEVTIFLPGGGGIPPSSLFLVALVAILAAGAVAFLYLRRPPPQESYYEHDVHRPAAERRKDFWPEDEEPAGRMKKAVKKRRV
jgi:hypothetical protein